MFATLLVALGAGVILALGLVHLYYTFVGPKFLPRYPALQDAMQKGHLQITRQTTIWRAWIGFNSSHGVGAILFGLVYIHLAVWHAPVLFGSLFLCGLGVAVLLAYLWLGWRYWFSVPFRGIGLATLLFVGGVGVARFG
jgi:hypothetical protein